MGATTVGKSTVCGVSCHTLEHCWGFLGAEEYFARMIHLMLPVLMTSSDLHYKFDASLVLQQLWLGANNLQSLADGSIFSCHFSLSPRTNRSLFNKSFDSQSIADHLL